MNVECELKLLCIKLELHDVVDLIDNFSDCKWCHVDLKLVILEAGDVQGITNDVLQMNGAVVDNLDELQDPRNINGLSISVQEHAKNQFKDGYYGVQGCS